MDQYVQLSAHLQRNFIGHAAEVPALADVGPWRGSFDEVPRPQLDEEVVRVILGIGAESAGGNAAEEEEGFQTVVKSEDDVDDGWSEDDFFAGYLGHVDADADPF